MAQICDDPNRYIDGSLQPIATAVAIKYAVYCNRHKFKTKLKEANLICIVFYCFILLLNVFAIGIALMLARKQTVDWRCHTKRKSCFVRAAILLEKDAYLQITNISRS